MSPAANPFFPVSFQEILRPYFLPGECSLLGSQGTGSGQRRALPLGKKPLKLMHITHKHDSVESIFR
jgi:hypothetical protein